VDINRLSRSPSINQPYTTEGNRERISY